MWMQFKFVQVAMLLALLAEIMSETRLYIGLDQSLLRIFSFLTFVACRPE